MTQKPQKLYKSFREPDPLRKLDDVVLKTLGPSQETGKAYKITLRDMFNALAAGNNDKQVMQKHRDVTPRLIGEARAELIAHFPGLYSDFIAGWPATPYRFLLDENLSRTQGVSLWNVCGRTTHTHHESITGYKDPHVWKWAQNNDVDAIITRDKRMVNHEEDLGLIAIRHAHDLLHKRKGPHKHPVEMPNMPLLIQISSHTRKTIPSLMKQHKDAIIEHLQHRTTPYLLLTATDCIAGPSYSDIARYKLDTIKTMAKNLIDAAKQNSRKQKPPSASPS